MKPGRGKGKGASFEREVCKKLSLWITNGEREDCLWRSAISGGRATVAYSKGKEVRQAGDVCAVSPEGHALTDHWYIECKHVRKLGLDQFLIKGTGPLAKFWEKCRKEAARYKRAPVIIAKQNGWPALLLAERNTFIDFNLICAINPVMLDWAIGGFEMNLKQVKWVTRSHANIGNR